VADATPDLDGVEVYFISSDGAGNTGVSKASVDGSTPPSSLPIDGVGSTPSVSPFADPAGVAMSLDGKTLYLADRGDHNNHPGALYALPTGGGAPVSITGTVGFVPTALEVAKVAGEETIFFTGTDQQDHPGVFSVPAAGGQVVTRAATHAFQSPAGLAVTADGKTLYVTDPGTGAKGAGSLVEIDGDTVKEFVGWLFVAVPTGVALSLDGSALVVYGSAHVPGGSPDVVMSTEVVANIDLASHTPLATSTGAPQTGLSTGGLHRARNGTVYAGGAGAHAFVIK
jgi:DNA-binding beta-propeller fold protein YncE